ncbi:MAG: hypothetical protein V3T01_01055 [Myxococcota bacterium]
MLGPFEENGIEFLNRMPRTPGNSGSAPKVRRSVKLAVFLVSLVVSLGLLELASGWLLPDRYFVWPPGFRATFDAGEVIRSGVDFPGKLTINSDGIRGEIPADLQTYRILAVGGSTTICVYLDDSKVWTRLLQERLNDALGEEIVWVGNVGRPGHSTAEHVPQVQKLLAQDSEIDAVVLLVGINDLLRYLPNAGKPLSRNALDPQMILARSFSFFPGWDEDTPWYLRNFVARIWRIVSWRPLPIRGEGNVRPMDKKGEWVASQRRHRARASELIPKLPGLTVGVERYVTNLEQIIDAARAEEVRLLFLTQPTLWRAGLSPAARELLWGGGPPWHQMRYGAPYYSVEALAAGMKRYNEALRNVCRTRGIECVDAASRIPQTARVFYDDAHFTEHGSMLLAGILADQLLEREALLRTQ